MGINYPPLDKNLPTEKNSVFPAGNGTILFVPSQRLLNIPSVLNSSLAPNLWQWDLAFEDTAFALATLYLSGNHIHIIVDREGVLEETEIKLGSS